MKLNVPLKIIIIILTLFIALFAPRVGSMVANQFNFDGFDPDGAFAWLYVHHIVQALIILIIMFFLTRYAKIQFGFGLGDKKLGIMYVKKFALYFLIYNLVVMTILVLTKNPVSFPYPVNLRNVTGQLSFQLLLSGPSEEIIFRAFIMTIIGLFISKRIVSNKFSIANIIAAAAFVIAHIAIQFSPWVISYEPMQLVYSLVLGLIYGICYEKTKSIYYPMALHSISNIISVSSLIIFQTLFF